jgi:hypothetical protein
MQKPVAELAKELLQQANLEVDEFNTIYDEKSILEDENSFLKLQISSTKQKLEEALKQLKDQNSRIKQDHSILQKQEVVIQAAVIVKQKDNAKLNTISAQLKELQRIDSKRLVKQNKGYKATIEDLKDRLTNSETARKNAIKQTKAVSASAKTEGNAAFHFDPETSNAIRVVPTLYVSKTNEFNGVPGTPVIEFMCHAKGITRQGTLLRDGGIGWANAKNSTPNKDESLIAKEFLLAWCKTNRVKV